MKPETRRWIDQDKAHCWHPFTQQAVWCFPENEPLVLTGGEGVWLEDSEGRRYIDGNSSIWTNIHGHSHPRLNRVLQEQSEKVAHTSYLGFANPVASELAERLCGYFPLGTLERCFFSDNGSTAIECALRMSWQYRQQTGEPGRKQVVAFENGYHGDTLGAASLGGVSKFTARLAGMGLDVKRVSDVTGLMEGNAQTVSAVIIEPVIQGVNEMRPWRVGLLRELREWCDQNHVHLILDEVMTGFGRTGTMFACEREQVVPDFLCLAKGLTGGYMPMAVTLTTDRIYRAFEGGAENVFYYGHSYTANQLGCALALESLNIFQEEEVLENLQGTIALFTEQLEELRLLDRVADVRQVGLIAGVELGGRKGSEVCLALREHGVLTRPINDTVVLMPPLSISRAELTQLTGALRQVLADA